MSLEFDIIERYLLQQMSIAERTEFEAQIAADPDLRNEVDQMREEILAVETYALKQKLRALGEKPDNNLDDRQAKWKNWVAILLVLSVIVALGYWWWTKYQSPQDPQQMWMAAAFEVDPGLPTPMSETAQYDFYDAMILYKLERYDEAIRRWKEIGEGINQDTLDYYIGMAYYNQGDYQQARIMLDQLPPDSELYQKSRWYHVAILIHQGKTDDALRLLQELPTDVSPSYETVKDHLIQ